jgi:uncharacterized protein (UPF0332 family)/predicted nucleotidyltransferase
MALAGLRPNEERTVRGVVEWARKRLGDRLVDIRLYGSKARGDSGPESDIDLFMLVTEKLTREEKEEFSRINCDLDLENATVTMAVIRTVEQWSDPLRRATLFHKNVESEGVRLVRAREGTMIAHGRPAGKRADALAVNGELARLRLRRAEATLREAHHMLEGGHLAGTVNRAYYAAFHAARALLATKGRDSARHAGVLALFDEHFVHAGIVAREHSTAIHALFRLRLQSDYEDVVEFSADEVREHLEKAGAFVAAARQALGSLLQDRED